MLKRRLTLILLSGLSMSVFYLLMESFPFSFSLDAIYIVFFFGLVFGVSYGLFALPIQLLLNKYLDSRKFNIIYFVAYLLGSLIVYIPIYGVYNNYEPFYANSAFYLYAFISALFFWTWDSIITSRNNVE
ncbi:UPF0715 family protein [Virgibacillus siamensis]|uniref:UPF0715 family protein n=1 Tax=Virgibacillus siamensis TaxID=480071 RepID=UPI003626ED14